MKNISVAAGIVLALAGFSPAVFTQTIGTSQQRLIRHDTTKLWTEANRHIPMCWHELNNFDSDAERGHVKWFVQQTIEEGWINLVNLTISWVDCPTSGTATHVRVMLREGDGGYNGTTLKPGMGTLSDAAQRLVPPPKDPPGLLMGFPDTWNDSDAERANFRNLVLHEFGHVLGFGHEHNRADPPAGSACHAAPIDSAISIGPADDRSIMAWSYCNTAVGGLTPNDVRGARNLYGTGRSGTNDFNSDARADILWHNAQTGETQMWLMSVGSRIGRATVVDEHGKFIPIGLPWRIVGSSDFNFDKRTDILWYNESTGESQIWYMNPSGHRLEGRATVFGLDGKPAFIGPPFSIVGAEDMNGDGYADIIWHNAQSGETQIWYMNSRNLSDRGTVLWEDGVKAALVGLPWRIVSSGDFNRDGRQDLLWHNEQSGETQIWHMNGHRLTGRGTVLGENGAPVFIGPPFSIRMAADFNTDGFADILWHNAQTGELQLWMMNGRQVARRQTVDAALDGGGAFVGPPWSIMRQ